MKERDLFEIRNYEFNFNLFDKFRDLHYAKDNWPIVYILSNSEIRQAYVGETTDTYARMSNHLKNDTKSTLTSVHLISSDKFNKSATLDIESNLIKYISGDGLFKLLNGNLGLANHNYYQKREIYWELFKSIWNGLRAKGVAKHSIDYIDNSDLFKYSPYKTLSSEQKNGLKVIMQNLLNNDYRNFIIEGGAGTGKTILAIFLFKLLNSNLQDFSFKEFGEEENDFIELAKALKTAFPNPKMALVVPMSSFRNTLKKVFRNVKDLNAKMVVGPSEIANEPYDIIIVDESHRLRRRVNLGTYFGAFDAACKKLGLDNNHCSELDWMVQQSKKLVLFYDENQSIKPSDTTKESFDKLKADKKTKIERLRSQFRVKGGNDYIQYVDDLLRCKKVEDRPLFNSKEYEFLLFDSIEEMVGEIKQRDEENGLSRMIAGYSWEWISKKDHSLFDIKIGSTELKWNNVADDWINSPNAVNEVGCIHTTQGYDLNYAGIIFGNEISYDKAKNEIVIIEKNYFDKNGKQSIKDPLQLKEYVINIYKTIMLRGIKGTYVYVCDQHLKEYLAQFIAKFKIQNEPKILPIDLVIPFQNAVPLFNLKAAAGAFSEVQEVSDYTWIELPSRYKPSTDLFACTVVGESMNKVIPNGSICLFRKYSGGSRNGKIVLVELTDVLDADTGSCYTVKEYQSIKTTDRDAWKHKNIVLKPLSYDENYKEITFSEDDELSLLKVIGVFESVL
ncbi:DNA/RNA helicase domain-containing protein [Haliscomenobacter sp.]|uniref:DNA/RNA helicase domain-containing protein n=1 Tax=Haliscomenobacter sp. TaxID=2717303 RepID=UPI003593793C